MKALRQQALWHRVLLRSLFLVSLGLVSCGESDQPKPITRWELFAEPFIDQWKEAAMPKTGGTAREAEGFVLKAGQPMTGIVFADWSKQGLPLTDYAISYEAMRTSGHDFFGALTFPVGSPERCVTFVLGGWGGSQVGISSIDGFDASENETGSSQHLENDRWYRVRIEVSNRWLKVLLNDRPIINTNITSRTLTLRAGEVVNCVPFGFATYRTEGKLRNCVIEKAKAPL